MELASTSIQKVQPRVIHAKNSHLITEEVDKLLLKGAIRTVAPCQNQFLSRVFVAPKKDGSHRPVTIEPVHNGDTLQGGEPGYYEGLTEAGLQLT